MTGKAGWMTAAMLGVAALVPGSVVHAQTQPDYGYPGASDRQARDDPYADDDVTGGEERGSQPQAQQRADDDFSDVTGGVDEQAGSPSRNQAYARPGERAEDARVDREREEAITECAVAVRDEAERDGGFAEVRQVQEPVETRGKYQVEGDIDARSSWRSEDGQTLHFTCSVQNGRIANLQFPRNPAAR